MRKFKKILLKYSSSCLLSLCTFHLSISTGTPDKSEQNRNSPKMTPRSTVQSARVPAQSARVQSARNRGTTNQTMPTPKLDVSPARVSPRPTEQRPQVTPDSKSQTAYLETENARLKLQLKNASANSINKNNITQTLEAFMGKVCSISLS